MLLNSMLPTGHEANPCSSRCLLCKDKHIVNNKRAHKHARCLLSYSVSKRISPFFSAFMTDSSCLHKISRGIASSPLMTEHKTERRQKNRRKRKETVYAP